VPKTCVVANADCFVGQCSEAQQACTQLDRPNRNPVLCQAYVTGLVVGAGAIAGIVIGVIAFAIISSVAGKVGYDYYMKQRGKMHGVQNNPLFEDKPPNENPFYAEKA